jgi:hypothetical protein
VLRDVSCVHGQKGSVGVVNLADDHLTRPS